MAKMVQLKQHKIIKSKAHNRLFIYCYLTTILQVMLLGYLQGGVIIIKFYD